VFFCLRRWSVSTLQKPQKRRKFTSCQKKWENLIQSDKTLQNRDEKTFKNIEKIIQSHKNIKKTGDEKPNEEPRLCEGGDKEVCI
jgi:predicted ATPase